MLLLGISLDFMVFFNKRFKIETVLVVIFRSGSIGSDTAVVILKTAHHDVENSVLVFSWKSSDLFRNFGCEMLVGQRFLDGFEVSPSGFDFIEINVSF